MTVLEDFYNWIIGIEEDDPVPYEIKHMYFAISFQNNICCLCYGGTELYQNNVINFEYFPLEAQFFHNQSFNNLTEVNLAMLQLKQLLDDCIDKKQFKNIFRDKKIYICELGKQNIEYKH